MQGLRSSPFNESQKGRVLRKERYLIPLVLVAVVAIGSAILFALYETNFQPHMFRGAYASYSGTSLIPGFSPVNTTRIYKVLDFNATSVEMLITSYLGTIQLQATAWEPYSANTRLHSSGQVFVKEYRTTQLVNGKTYQNLVADVYVEGNSTTTYYYVSRTAAFPVEIVTNAGLLTIELTLAKTNVHWVM